MSKLDAAYWQNRYAQDDFPWDIGYSNKVLTDYVEQNIAKDARVLIPGAGSGYEAEYLWNKGYTHVYALDFAADAKSLLMSRGNKFPEDQYLTGDFFELDQRFDVFLEQTFFCALNPSLRPQYVKHVHHLLNTEGVLFGLLFEMDKQDGPPYGGNTAEYVALFQAKFELKTVQKCLDSIAPRLGQELVIEFVKK